MWVNMYDGISYQLSCMVHEREKMRERKREREKERDRRRDRERQRDRRRDRETDSDRWSGESCR